MRDNGIEPTIIEYLKDVPSAIIEYLKDVPSEADFHTLSKQLGKRPAEYIRKGEADFKANNIGDLVDDDDAMTKAMATYPKIMERPIVVKGDQAVLGRPPENVLELL